MEKADERRAEQRLSYRWPVRFAGDPRQKPLSGQMFDLSSKGMAMLFHASEDCPRPDQSITANFGVPHFDAHGSFDTAFFNRVGRVCRIDKLTSRVNRIAVQFAEPLFFKPGEQDITESDAQLRLRAKARSIVNAKGKAAVSEEDLARAEERLRIHAEAEKKFKARIEVEARAKEIAKAEVQDQTRLREQADSKARTEAQKRAAAEEQARESARLYEREIVKVKAKAAREVAMLKDEASYKIAEAKAQVRAKLLAKAKAEGKAGSRTEKKDRKSGKAGLVKKVDEFITDRGQIY